MKDKFIYIFFLVSLLFSNALAITCSKKHKVSGRETCKTIAKNGHISLTNFYKWNPSLKKTNCASLHAGQYVCLSVPLATSSAAAKKIPTSTTMKSTTTTKSMATATKTSTSLPTPTNGSGLTTVVLDEARFCLFLPPTPPKRGDFDAIANSEKNARVFCTEANLTPGAQLMPQGFITSAHYQFNTTAGFVQVTGNIDRTKYSLSQNDGGGQYDNHGAGSPPLSMCQGYRYYVSLIEPDIEGFCIRCCVTYQDCNASRSAYGCKRVAPPLDFSV